MPTPDGIRQLCGSHYLTASTCTSTWFAWTSLIDPYPVTGWPVSDVSSAQRWP
jgi:hypothetical protein